MLGELARKIARKGFVGPQYRGVLGKARFAFESVVARKDFLFVATPESFAAVPAPAAGPLELHTISSFDELGPYAADLEREYYPGFLDAWRAPFGWGEELVLGTVEGQAACFHWLQRGSAAGVPVYWGSLLAGDARMLRAGVAPSFRRQGLNTLMDHMLLDRLFAAGMARVYIECHRNNVPSIRAFLKAGFRPLRLFTVVELRPFRSFLRWASAAAVRRELLELGIEVSDPGTPCPAGESLS